MLLHLAFKNHPCVLQFVRVRVWERERERELAAILYLIS